MTIKSKIMNKDIKVAVIGLGYVGLPLAVEFAKARVPTFGFDVNETRVNKINEGKSHIPDVREEDIKELVSNKLLSATKDFNGLAEVDVIFICVPTPFTQAKAPDISYIVQASRAVKDRLRNEQLIVLQSTTYPGTTEEVVKPILEETGLKAGEDFFLAFSPERIDPGNKKFTAKNTPKVVGGVNQISTELSCAVFTMMIEDKYIYPVSSPRTAEMCKLLENTFRSVNIALVNELALLCDRMKINIWEVIEAASTKPFGFMPFYPGPGVGGHCIPVDPYYLSWKAREYDFYTKFIELAAEVNQSMPYHTVNKLSYVLNAKGKTLNGANILVLGVAFKKDIDDARNSPSLEVIRLLISHGAIVKYNDPFIPEVNIREEFKYGEFPTIILKSTEISKKLLSSADCVMILVKHSAYDYGAIRSESKMIFDAVNAIEYKPGKNNDRLFKL